MELIEKIKKQNMPWSIVSMMVLAINSYVLMLYRNRENQSITYIVVVMILLYLIVMPLLTCRLKQHPKRQRILGRVNKGFRVFYTGISLTAVILNMIAASPVVEESLDAFIVEQQGKAPLLILTAVMGFSCFWSPKLITMFKRFLLKQKPVAKIINQFQLFRRK